MSDITEKTTWFATDGQEFPTLGEAVAYQEALDMAPQIEEYLDDAYDKDGTGRKRLRTILLKWEIWRRRVIPQSPEEG